ncbi:math and lrr domain-containing protein [Lasius niger]|uniref:Math and lrr domain-containing protein n=1 Tax=Lasius niger TaxID=67767 RepID=A0A0J7N0N0_LASNI|nr:math and lrr domain-containing protein [Lasius niger]
MTDRESLAKQFVSPEPKFEKPKSQLFSSIIQSYLNEKQDDKKLLSQEDNSHKVEDGFAHSNKNQNLLIADNKTESNSIAIKNSEDFTLNEGQYLTLNSRTDSEKRDILPFDKKNSKKLFTFNEFVKVKLEDIQKESPKEGVTLLNLYRKQMDASQEVQATSDNAIISKERDTLEIAQKSNESISAVSEKEDSNFNIVTADDNLIDTSIKVWNKKRDTECVYAKPIKITKNLYKPGMTYRINDCYYDDDGEFLYRVPGIQA